MRLSSPVSCALLLCLFSVASAAESADPAAIPATHAESPHPTVTHHRVVFQVAVDGEAAWNEVLTNVENVQHAFGADNVDIEIVSHGKGAGLVLAKNQEISQRLRAIEATGPRFAICNNTLNSRGITPAEITPGVIVVDSGIAEVIRRVEEGWVYIKVGS